MRRLLLLSRWVLVGWSPIRKLLSPQHKDMAGTDAAPFLSYLGRLVSLNAHAFRECQLPRSRLQGTDPEIEPRARLVLRRRGLLSRTHLLHLFSNECGGFEHSISVKYDLRFGDVLQRNRAGN